MIKYEKPCGGGYMPNVDNNLNLDVINLFNQTAIAVQKYSDSAFYRKAKLSTVKYSVLQILADSEGPVIPSEISIKIQRVRHDITTLITRMTKEGYVEVTPSTTDRRSVNIILTKKGRAKYQEAEPIANEIANQVMIKMGKTTISSMRKSLNVFKQNSLDGFNRLQK